MKESEVQPKVPVNIRAGSGTEIFLVDSNFKVLHSKVGELSENVPPGIYKLRFRTGGTIRDEFVEVPQENTQTFTIDKTPMQMQFASSAPLQESKNSNENQQNAWRCAWEPPTTSFGVGGYLFVMARNPDKHYRHSVSHYPWHGISLLDHSGKILCSLSRDEESQGGEEIGILHVELDPGTYILRVDTGLYGLQETAVTISAGWQTQILFLTRSMKRMVGGRMREVRRVDLVDAAIFMCKPFQNPTDAQFRLTELARQGLVQGRMPIQDKTLKQILGKKIKNPMFEILVVHLLLNCNEPDLRLCMKVLNNLEQLVPGHPDVRALRLKLDQDSTPEPFSEPPMLYAGWRFIVERSTTEYGLVVPASLADRIGYAIIGEGPWLNWRRTVEMSKNPILPGYAGSLERLSLPDILTKVAGKFVGYDTEKPDTKLSGLSRMQRAVVKEVTVQCGAGKDDWVATVVRNLGVSATTVYEIAKKTLQH